nr:MAG TPA: hypothetical protein [Caudoviricetes sp.]
MHIKRQYTFGITKIYDKRKFKCAIDKEQNST